MEYVQFDGEIDRALIKSLNIVIKNSQIGKGVKIYSNVCVENSTIEDGATIDVNSYICASKIGKNSYVSSSFVENSRVGANCKVGPFAHLRENANVQDNCRVGNFVEIKNSTIGSGSKMAHLAYIGDADIGKNCNIGCGVVFCNYNGKIKQRSILKDNVFVGSNANIIAPVTIEENAFIAAGSTINLDVPANKLAIARARQENKDRKNN